MTIQAVAALLLCALTASLAVAGIARDLGDAKATAGFIVYKNGGGPIPLVGEWERYEGGFEALGRSASPSLVPLSLRALPYASAGEAGGSATYRIRVGISGEPRRGLRRMALYAPGIAAFDSAHIDGRLVYDRSLEPDPSPVFHVATEGISVELALTGGPGGPRLERTGLVPLLLVFGEAGEVERFKTRAIGMAIAICCSFIIIGIVAFLLFLFWRKNREFLGFFVYMAAAGLLYALRFAAAFPLSPLAARLGSSGEIYAAALGLHYSALAFLFWSIYPKRLPSAAWAAALALPIILALAVNVAFVTKPGLTGPLELASLGYYGLFALFLMALLAAMAAKKDMAARWLLPAFLAKSAAIVAEPLLPPAFSTSFYLAPAGVLAFGFVCTLLLVKKVSDSFEATEALSEYVDSVSRTVKSFIPKEFLEHLEKEDVTDLRLGDHAKKEMTIFFSDIRAFTELSERLTVEENFAFINSYLSRVVPIIRENGGFVDKYVGDGIMALFPDETGPDEAIRAAIAMQGKMLEYNGHRAKVGYTPISMGVGIHSGDLMLGVVGVSDRMENTVISDAVNLASRLQAITKAFNIAIAISEQAFKELEDPGAYKYRFIGKVKVKGKAAPVSVFEILDGIAPELFERKMRANMFFEQGMLAYYQKDFAGSIYYFKRVLDILPEDGAAGFYLDNCMNKAALA